jgi:hypothetical protein
MCAVGAAAVCDAAGSQSGAIPRSASLDEEQRKVLKSSMNKAIDAQRDGLLTLKPPTESLLAVKRRQEAALCLA